MTNQDNQKIVKLVKQVDLLSKVVDGLQKEINEIKTKSSRDKNNRSKQITDDKASSSPLQRLRFFHRDNKTSKADKIIDKNDKITDNANKGDVNPSENNKSRRRHRNVNFENNTDSPIRNVEQRTKIGSMQTEINPEEFIEISNIICSVKSRSAQTEQIYPEEYNDESCTTTKEKCKKVRNEKKKSKGSHKHKKNKCAKDCPYLEVCSSKKAKTLSDSQKCQINCATQASCEKKTDKSRKLFKKSKNKKPIMDSCESDFSDKNNFKIEDFGTIINISDKMKEIKLKNQKCENCSKKCKTANVVKIGKAILTRDPPVIVISPRAFKNT